MRNPRWSLLLALFGAALCCGPVAAQQPQAGDFTNDDISGQPTAPAIVPRHAEPAPDNTGKQHKKETQQTGKRARTSKNEKPAKATNEKPGQRGAESITASLVDENREAQERSATVVVRTRGVKMVDPDRAKEQPRAGEGHLHFRLDDGPVIASKALRMEFHDLKPGTHTITVMLAGNDHEPLAPVQTLPVTIPSAVTAKR